MIRSISVGKTRLSFVLTCSALVIVPLLHPSPMFVTPGDFYERFNWCKRPTRLGLTFHAESISKPVFRRQEQSSLGLDFWLRSLCATVFLAITVWRLHAEHPGYISARYAIEALGSPHRSTSTFQRVRAAPNPFVLPPAFRLLASVASSSSRLSSTTAR